MEVVRREKRFEVEISTCRKSFARSCCLGTQLSVRNAGLAVRFSASLSLSETEPEVQERTFGTGTRLSYAQISYFGMVLPISFCWSGDKRGCSEREPVFKTRATPRIPTAA